MDMLSKFLLPGIGLVLTLSTGFWLSGAGKPLNAILFNLHKLIALAAVVMTIMQLAKILSNAGLPGLQILLLVAAGLGVVALLASGGLMSAGKLSYSAMLLVHRVAPVVMIAAMAAEIYLLSGRSL